jgi:hypothetical protein
MWYSNRDVRFSRNNNLLYNNASLCDGLHYTESAMTLLRHQGSMKQILIQTTLTNPIFYRDASNLK